MTRSLSRRLVASLASVALAGGLAVAVAPSAAAGGDCPADRLCFFFNSNFQGARADFKYEDASLRQELFSDRRGTGYNVVVNNNAASVINHSGGIVWLYGDEGCTGAPLFLAGGEHVNLRGTALYNNVSSIGGLGLEGECVVRDQTPM